MKRFLLTLCVFLTLPPTGARAQRTSAGEDQIALSFGTTFSSLGGELLYGQYLLRGYWMAGLGFNDRIERDIPSGETVAYQRLQARGGYMFRLLSSYTRGINLYGGGDAFLGVEMLDGFHHLTQTTLKAYHNNGYNDHQFIYGFAPRLELELFLSPAFALLVEGRAPVCFGSRFPVLGWELGLGAKVNF